MRVRSVHAHVCCVYAALKLEEGRERAAAAHPDQEEGGRGPKGHDRPQHDDAQPAADEAGPLAVEPERTEQLGFEQLL